MVTPLGVWAYFFCKPLNLIVILLTFGTNTNTTPHTTSHHINHNHTTSYHNALRHTTPHPNTPHATPHHTTQRTTAAFCVLEPGHACHLLLSILSNFHVVNRLGPRDMIIFGFDVGPMYWDASYIWISVQIGVRCILPYIYISIEVSRVPRPMH